MSELLKYDSDIWSTGNLLLGLDEAGYGCLSGSMFVAGIIFNPMEKLPEDLADVKDSKKLSETKRYQLAESIYKHALYVWIFQITPEEIDNGNVYWLRYKQATTEVKKVAQDHSHLTVVFDGNRALDLPGIDSRYLIKGDSKSFTIAAASIIAKSLKDREMHGLHKKYPEYSFDKNKGYGTKAHKDAIIKYGLTSCHRKTYCKKFV